jgi:hypothetical protein
LRNAAAGKADKQQQGDGLFDHKTMAMEGCENITLILQPMSFSQAVFADFLFTCPPEFSILPLCRLQATQRYALGRPFTMWIGGKSCYSPQDPRTVNTAGIS